MSFLYSFSIRIYFLFILIASLFNKKAKLWIKGRYQILDKIKKSIPSNEKTIWFHCASLGEFEQGRPLIEEIKKDYPNFKLVLTFFSPSGYEIRKNYTGADYIFYLPIDTLSNAKKFIEYIHPSIVFFIKYEFWFNYLSVLKEKEISTFLVSGIFRKDHYFFKWYGSYFNKKLIAFHHFFVQNKESETLLNSIGYKNTTITGDTRFDRVLEVSKKASQNKIIEQFKSKSKLLVAGSTWLEDEKIISKIELKNKQIKILIAPHEISESHISSIIHLFEKRRVALYSKANESNINDFDVLIIDNIGMLSSLYQYADFAFIGGGFGKGIHNILEAAVFGKPILFGTNYKRFQEAIDLVKSKGAFSVSNQIELAEIINTYLSKEDTYLSVCQTCKQYILENKGATEKIIRNEIVATCLRS